MLILTPTNLTAPWLLFEAGALSKHVDTAKVAPVLFGLTNEALAQPLAQFQGVVFGEGEMRRLVKQINARLESPLDADVLTRIFDKFWKDLDDEVTTLMQAAPQAAPQRRPVEDIAEETLAVVRQLTRDVRRPWPAPRIPVHGEVVTPAMVQAMLAQMPAETLAGALLRNHILAAAIESPDTVGDNPTVLTPAQLADFIKMYGALSAEYAKSPKNRSDPGAA